MYDPGDLRVFDPILTGFSLGYEDQTLYGDQIMPITRVGTNSGRYRVFDRSNWVMFPDRREPGTVANEVRGGKWSLDTFKVVEHSLQAPIHDEEREENAVMGSFDAGLGLDLDPEQDATELVTRSILLGHEKKVSDLIRNTATYAVGNTVTKAGASQWDDYTGGTASTSDPVTDIRVAIRKVKALTGRVPNTMVIPSDGIEYIENHPRVVARYQNFSITDEDAWRQLSGFEGKILLVDSVYNAADNIDAAEVMTSFWGKDVWIGLVDDQDGMRTKTFGKTFARPYPQGDIRPTDKWREEARKTDVVRVSQRYDLKVVSNVAGYLIKTAFSASAF